MKLLNSLCSLNMYNKLQQIIRDSFDGATSTQMSEVKIDSKTWMKKSLLHQDASVSNNSKTLKIKENAFSGGCKIWLEHLLSPQCRVNKTKCIYVVILFIFKTLLDLGLKKVSWKLIDHIQLLSSYSYIWHKVVSALYFLSQYLTVRIRRFIYSTCSVWNQGPIVQEILWINAKAFLHTCSKEYTHYLAAHL